jgi:hypothetical protein
MVSPTETLMAATNCRLTIVRYAFAPLHSAFEVTDTPFNHIVVSLDYDKSIGFTVSFDGYTLEFVPIGGNTSREIDYKLSKPGHPLNEPTSGIAAGNISVYDSNGKEFISANIPFNLSSTEKVMVYLDR